MTPPLGPLRLIGHNDSAVYFIDLTQLKKVDEDVTVRVFEIFAPSFGGFKESLQSVSSWAVNCQTMDRKTLSEQVFSEAGVFKFASGPASVEHLRPGDAWDTVAQVACGHTQTPAFPSVTTGAPLVKFSQALLSAPPVSGAQGGVARVVDAPSTTEIAARMGKKPHELAAAVLLCVGGPEGMLAACAISDERPAGVGLAEAALSLIGKFRVQASDASVESTEGAVFPVIVGLPGSQ